MSAAPADKSGVAGGLLNLLRAFGGGVGVAASSVVLAWGLESAAGVHERTAGASEAATLAAAGDVLVLLALFGALGAAMALIRSDPKADARKAVGAGAPKPS
jgi:hypothetical protein